jgi:hypothetical protein
MGLLALMNPKFCEKPMSAINGTIMMKSEWAAVDETRYRGFGPYAVLSVYFFNLVIKRRSQYREYILSTYSVSKYSLVKTLNSF